MTQKDVYATIIETYPELLTISGAFDNLVELQNDSDGLGTWIVFWNYEKPLPAGLKIGK